MADVEITPEAAEGYLAAVADHLETKGYKLPSALPYAFYEAESWSGAITLLGALKDGGDLALVWDARQGWQAGYPLDGEGLGGVTMLELDIAPPPWIVERAVGRIVRRGHLTAGQPSPEFGPIVHGPEELPAYEPGALELAQAGALALDVRAARLRGDQATGVPGTWEVDHARPIVAAVWVLLRDRLAEVDRLRAELVEARQPSGKNLAKQAQERAGYFDDKLHELEQGRLKAEAERARARTEAGQLRAELAAFLPPGRLAPGETPALCPDCKEAHCVPGLPGCSTCIRERLESLERAERAADGQVEALHAELNETRRAAHRDRLAADGAVNRIEQLAAERDQAEHDVDRLTTERDEALQARNNGRIERDRLRAVRDRVRLAWESARVGRREARTWIPVAERLGAHVEQLRTELDEARAERNRARTVAAAAERTLGQQIDRAIKAEEERDEARAEAGQLRAELEEHRLALRQAIGAPDLPWRILLNRTRIDHAGLIRQRNDANAEVKRLQSEKAAWRSEHERLALELRRVRWAWDSARAGRRSARLLNKELIVTHRLEVKQLRADLEHAQQLEGQRDAYRDGAGEVATPKAVAAHVLYHFGAGGMEAGPFTRDLILLLTRADPANRRGLAASFPAYGEAVRIAQDTEDGIDRLRVIAGEPERKARQC
jgi:hypothetical protein